MIIDKKEIEEMLKNELNIGKLIQNENKDQNTDNKDINEKLFDIKKEASA